MDVTRRDCYRSGMTVNLFPDPRPAGRELERQLLEYRTILDHAGIAVIFTRKRRVEHCNRHAEILFGWEAGALTGQAGRVFYPDEPAYAEVGRLAGPVLSRGETWESDVEFVRRDGSRFYGHVIARAVDPSDTEVGTIWIASDVTAARQEKLKEQRLLREQQQIFDRAEIGIAFVRDRTVQRCNRRFEEMIGFAPGEAIGKSTRIYFRSDEEWVRTGEEIYRAIAETGAYHGEWPLQRLDGKTILCRFSGSMLDPEHPEMGYVWLHEDVGERRAIERALQETHREMAMIFENAMIGISYQRDRTILRCNRRLEEIFGWPPGGLLGQSTRVLFDSDEAWADAGKVYQTLGDQATFDGVMRYARRDGSPIWVHIVGRTIDTAEGETWIWSYEDITARRAAETALNETMREYARIFENAMVGISYMRDRVLLRCNRRFEEIFGYGPGELIGKSMRMLYASSDEFRETARRVLDCTDPVTGFSGEIRYRHRDGRMIWAQVNGRPVREGEHVDWIWTHQDVTQAHETVTELAASHESLTAAHAQLAQAETMASLGRMVAVIAHELNTPIGNARLAASTLREQSHAFAGRMAAGVRRSDLDALLASIETGTRLLDSGLMRAAHLISSFKQIAVDQTSSQRRVFRLDTLIDEIGTTLEPGIRRSGCTLVWKVEPDIELDSCPGPLGHVLINLIDNAVRHAFDGHEPGTVTVSVQPVDPDDIELKVCDDGAGIPPANLRRVFDPFFTTRLGRGGTGLGLSIVYNIVTGVLGGKITVTSTLGGGACFTARLPRQAPNTPPAVA